MPFTLADPAEDVQDPFADLAPDNVSPELTGGETRDAPALQTVNGQTREVPKAIANTFEPPDVGPFSDLVQTTSPRPVTNYGEQFGEFADIVPPSPTPESDAVTAGLQNEVNAIADNYRTENARIEANREAQRKSALNEPVIGAGVFKAGLWPFESAARASEVFFPGNPFAKVARGLREGAADVESSLTSPLNLNLVAAGGPLARLGKLGTVILSSAFEAQAIQHAPEQWAQFRRQIAAGDYEGATRNGINLLAGLGLPAAAVITHGAKGPEGAKSDAIPERSAAPEISRPSGEGTNQPADSGGIRPGEQGPRPAGEGAPATPEAIPAAGERPQAEAPSVPPEAKQPVARPVEDDLTQATAEEAPVHTVNVAGAEFSGSNIGEALDKARQQLAPQMSPQEFVRVARETEADFGRGLDQNEIDAYANKDVAGAHENAPIPGASEREGQAPAREPDTALPVPEDEATIVGPIGRRRKGKATGRSPDEFATEITPVSTHIINDIGGLMSKSTAKKRGLYQRNAELWDGAPKLSNPTHNKIYRSSGGETPDHVAASLYEQGLIRDPYVDTMWEAIAKESQTVRNIADQRRAAAADEARATASQPAREGGEQPKAAPSQGGAAEAPKLRQGEKGTAELFQGEDQPFNLAGEKGIDYGKRQLEAERAAQEKSQAQAEQENQQMGLRLKPKVDEGGFIDPPTMRDIADLGRRVYQGAKDFAKWSGEMVRHLGEKIRPHLQALFDSITGRNILPQARESGAIGGVGVRHMKEIDKATTARQAKLQRSTQDTRRAERTFSRVEIAGKPGKTRVLPEKVRNAVTIYREAAGDQKTLAQWASAAKGKLFRQAAQDALSLKPEEAALASRAANVFSVLHARGRAFGVIKAFRQNYVPHIFDLGKGQVPGGVSNRKLAQNFRHARAGQFETFFEADQAGYVPKTLDIAKLVPAYLGEMNRVIADRQMVRDIVKGFGTDGRPLATHSGLVQKVEGVDPKDVTYLVRPDAKRAPVDEDGNPKFDVSDYRVLPEQPALKEWLWREKDTEGNPIFVKSDILLHPEAYKRLHSMLSKSELPVPKAYTVAAQAMKREMFSFLAPFHQVQEGTHAIGHTVNPFFGLKSADLRLPQVKDAVENGLMLEGLGPGYSQYIEGVGAEKTLFTRGLRKTKVLAPLADLADAYQTYLFRSYIPRLKMTTYEHIVPRNMKRFQKELASGELSERDVKLLSAEQVNDAFGHQNVELRDRTATVRQLWSELALAPDFLESRVRFFGQAVKGIYSKAGREQLRAIVVLASVQAGTAALLGNLIPGGKWDWKDPFTLRVNNRRYTLRSVPEDFLRFATEVKEIATGESQGAPFIQARINPLLQTIWQTLSGLNYRGEKVTAGETLLELLGKYVPITLRQIPGLRKFTEPTRTNPVSPLEQLAGSLGLKISRVSPIGDTYQLANKWVRDQNLPKDRGSYPVSRYQQLRYALEDQDWKTARKEYLDLVSDEITTRKRLPLTAATKVHDGFVESVMHPFTGSRENDRKFSASLKGDDKITYQLAVERRKEIIRRLKVLKGLIRSGRKEP